MILSLRKNILILITILAFIPYCSIKTMESKFTKSFTDKEINRMLVEANTKEKASELLKKIMTGHTHFSDTEEELITLIDILIKKGANVNVTFGQWGTPLSVAISSRLKDLARLLIKNGADINATPLFGSPLSMAVDNNDIDMVKLLISRGVDINGQSPMDGATALMIAAIRGSKDIVKLLLENGADVTLKNDKNMTAYDYARKRRYNEIAELILSYYHPLSTERIRKQLKELKNRY